MPSRCSAAGMPRYRSYCWGSVLFGSPMRFSGATTFAWVCPYTGIAHRYPVRPATRSATRIAAKATAPRTRRGEGRGGGETIVAGTRVRGRSGEPPGNGRVEPDGAAMRDGGPDTAFAGGPEMARGSAGRPPGGNARRGDRRTWAGTGENGIA